MGKKRSLGKIGDNIKTTDKKPLPRRVVVKDNLERLFKVRRNKNFIEGEDWLFRGGYPTGTMYCDRRWEEPIDGWDYVQICFKFHDGRVKVYNSSLPEYKELIKSLGGEIEQKDLFPHTISALLNNGEKIDATKLNSLAKDFDITNQNEIIQQAELGVVMTARKIALSGESLRVRYEKIRDLYDHQPTISPKDGRASFLQQFSTPAPLAFLAGEFVKGAKANKKDGVKWFEPTAGNGMLTIAMRPNEVVVNELDEIRVKNLKELGFSKVLNQDATKISYEPTYAGVITNPPFMSLERKDYLYRKGRKGDKEIEYTIQCLDHKLAIMALESMVDDGRCAIIVGGKLSSKMFDFKKAYWKDDRLFGEFSVFVNYINRQYNLVDILYINGDLYAKQGTTYPIVMLLVDGRKEWNAEPSALWHKYDETLDKPINSFTEYWDRMIGHIEKQETKQAPVQSSLVTFSNERVVKNYPEDYTAKDILFKGEKIGFAIMNESKTYYIDGDKLDYILNGRYTKKGSFLNIWCYSIYDKTKEHFTKESFFCDGLRFVFSKEDDVIKFMSLFDEPFIKNAQSASSDLDRKRKLLILAKAKIKIAQAKAKAGKMDLFGLLGINEETFAKIETTNGELLISSLHGKIERDENVKIATYLCNRFGFSIILLSNKNDEKSADSYNKTLQREEEYKTPNGSKSSVDRVIRDGSKQADYLVIRILNDFDYKIISKVVHNRVKRTENIIGIMFIDKDFKTIRYTREEIIDDEFEIKKEDFV